MKAPDKIYVDDLAVVNDCSTKISTKPLSNFSEYIRNDALLKWLESMVYEHNEDRFDDGFNAALGQVIDKLNSM